MVHKVTCPYCFATFVPQDIKFRCATTGCPAEALDPIYASARGMTSVRMGCVLIPRKIKFSDFGPLSVYCEACRTESRTRICPNCHFELTQDIDQIDQLIIAVIGGRATGKSHYIASLINRLNHEVGQEFQVVVTMMGDDTKARWERDFYDRLFVQKQVINPTRSGEVDSVVKSPLMFRFIFDQGKRLFGNGRRLLALNISFFDTAGEDMTALSKMIVQNRYICHAHGIIFLLDPLQIPTVRSLLPHTELPKKNLYTSPDFIVDNLRELFEREHGLAATQQVHTPVAFTLSKIDMLRPLLDGGSPLLRPRSAPRPGIVNLNDLQSVHTDVSNYLEEWINPGFLGKIRNGFSDYSFFGVSALGEQPVNDRLSVVSPLRVEDPLLWLLARLGLVKGRKE